MKHNALLLNQTEITKESNSYAMMNPEVPYEHLD